MLEMAKPYKAVMTRGNSTYSSSVGIPVTVGGSKVPIKHVLTCSDLNTRDHQLSQDPGGVCQYSTYCINNQDMCNAVKYIDAY